jgi:hypothetical protein
MTLKGQCYEKRKQEDPDQECQIFSLHNIQEQEKNVPNDHKIYQKTTKYTK